MNKFLTLFIVGIVASYSLKSQCDIRMYDIYTPNCSPVATFFMCESSTQIRLYWDTYYAQTYPNAEQIETHDGYSSTRKFNCHGYAWLRVDQGIDRWIGTGWPEDITDPELIYMTDGSYTQVSQETYPGKVFWGSGDHSSVTTNQTGWFISKWNEYPLMKHQWNYSPYGSTNLKYYRLSPSVSGPSTVCSSGATFTINNLPSGCSVSWDKSSNLTYVSGQGTASYTVRATGSGSGWVQVTVTSGCGQVTLPQKNVHVGITASFTGNSTVLYLKTGTWTATASCGTAPYNYDWFLRKEGAGEAVLVATGNPLTLKSVKAGTTYLSAEEASDPIINQPINTTIFYLYTRASDVFGIYITPEKRIVAYGDVDLVPAYMLYMQKSEEIKENQESDGLQEYIEVYPNPASDNLTVNIVSDSREQSEDNITVSVFDTYMNKVKVLKTRSKTNTLNIADLKKGIYFIQVQYNEKQWVEKIMVE